MVSRRTDIDDSDVQYMYEVEGMTQQDIADFCGVCQMTICCRLHPEKQKEYNKQWREKNPEKHRENNKQWRKENPEYEKERQKRWQEENPEYAKEYIKQWWQTEKGKEWMRKHNADRRDLGSIELNKPFDDSEGHHIDETYIIHIPKELHKSIWHNVRTDEGMSDINEIAFHYISEETFDKLEMGEI